MHLGSTPNHQSGAFRQLAVQQLDRLGIVPEGRIDPRDALAMELWQLHCRKQACELLIAGLELGEGASGLLQGTFHATGQVTGERAVHPYVTLRLELSKRIEAVASACHRAGVEDRRIQLDAQRAEAIAGLVTAIADRLGLVGEARAGVLRFAADELRQLGA